jgi:hypothetical protein
MWGALGRRACGPQPASGEDKHGTNAAAIRRNERTRRDLNHTETRRFTTAKHPETLYHFTCRLWWRFIEKEGIRHGEVPIGRGRLLDHPNLTTDPDPANQGWACSAGESLSGGGQQIVWVVSKLAVRIGVELPSRDPKLIRWVDLARQTGMDERTLRRLDAAGGGHMCDWWVYRGIIRPKRIVSVEFLDGGRVPAVEQRLIEVTRTARNSAHVRRFLDHICMLL